MDGRQRPRAAGRGTLNVERLAPGLWTWTAGEATSVYYEAPDAIVLVDARVPAAAPDEERFWRALDRDVELLGLPVALLFTGEETADAERFRSRYPTLDTPPAGVEILAGAIRLEAVDTLVVATVPPPGATAGRVVATAPR